MLLSTHRRSSGYSNVWRCWTGLASCNLQSYIDVSLCQVCVDCGVHRLDLTFLFYSCYRLHDFISNYLALNCLLCAYVPLRNYTNWKLKDCGVHKRRCSEIGMRARSTSLVIVPPQWMNVASTSRHGTRLIQLNTHCSRPTDRAVAVSSCPSCMRHMLCAVNCKVVSRAQCSLNNEIGLNRSVTQPVTTTVPTKTCFAGPLVGCSWELAVDQLCSLS